MTPRRRPREEQIAARLPRASEPSGGTLTDVERATFEAIAARIWPGNAEDPGAREAGVLHYLERALAGPYREMLGVYRAGLADVNHAATERHGRAFADLAEAEQDGLLAAMDGNDLPGFTSMPPRDFLTLCIDHTMEGMFSDPIHGGNRDFAGWRAVGYPGPQGGYTAAEQVQMTPLRRPFRSLADEEGE
jgi:hypothetical protein